MKNIIRSSAWLFIFLFSFSTLQSQTETETDSLPDLQTVIVKMNNGDEFTGQILSQNENFLVLKTENGEMSLIRSNIKSMESYIYSGKFSFPNPHDTRYFFGPSGIAIDKGKGYYQNVYVTFNFINYGISDYFSIGGGFEFISTISGYPIWFLTPKFGFDLSEKSHLGAGFIMMGLAGEGTATLGYGVFTSGGSETNFSIGAGYGLLDGELSKYPAIMFAGTTRTSKTIALLTENYIITDQSGHTVYLGVHGIRIMTKKSSFDIGLLFIPQIADEIPALPYVGYVRVF